MTPQRETAITETIEYETRQCHNCGVEVDLSSELHGEPEPTGYLVLLGAGKMETELMPDSNHRAAKTNFKGSGRAPAQMNVSGCIICEDCAKKIHRHNGKPPFEGELPRLLDPNKLDPMFYRPLKFAVGLAVFIIFLTVVIVL